MKRRAGLVAAMVGTFAVTLSSAVVAAQPAAAAAPTGMSGAAPAGLSAPWAREWTRYGARDVDQYHIAHVRELQYRLKWVGLFPGTPTGYYGDVTRAAVKTFQQRRHLFPSGTATGATWRLLLQRTVRNPGGIPATCKTAGWHACYDRKFHSVTLWYGGSIRNTWLVRGGSYTTQTRVGTHQVYYRDIDHVSSLYHAPMPYSQFFDGGEALHGSRLMMDPFVDHSHGCVNFYVEDARQLWNATHDKTLWVTVYGAWS
ncbi:MAG: L,D-transpeptidase family protein [Nocardioidaceae bacterium]